METLEIITEGLNDFPKEDIWYFGPNNCNCTSREIIMHRGYMFEKLTYQIKGNGKHIIHQYNKSGQRIQDNLKISLSFNWTRGYQITFENLEHPKSNKYFCFNAIVDHGLEKVFDKLILISEKQNTFKEKGLSAQYTYAYIIFLFFDNHEIEIRATKFSDKYQSLKKITQLITMQLTDNAFPYYFSKDEIYYKFFDRFVNKQMEVFKNKPINFD